MLIGCLMYLQMSMFLCEGEAHAAIVKGNLESVSQDVFARVFGQLQEVETDNMGPEDEKMRRKGKRMHSVR